MIIGSSISHYKIVEKLGEGGMGVVYKAEDVKLERTVALKFLAQHLLNDAEAKERFLREAKAAAALHHSNVCPVHEIDEVDGKTFLAMAFLEGESLEDRIAQGPLSIKEALDIARQVAEGLDAAHAKAIVHRDIKPANIMVDSKGHATIMDFGLARLTEASRLTKKDTAMGTVAYMSPEHAQGIEVDSRTDIWAVGCVLYEMVSGQRPFLGQYDQALLYEIIHEEAAPLTSIRAGVPMELEFIVGECLAKDRDDRTGAAHDLARKLRTLAEKLKSGRSTILRTGAVPATMTAAHTLNPAATLPPDAVVMKRSERRALMGAAGVLAAALLVVLFVHLTATPPAASEKLVRRFSFSQDGLFPGAISPDGRHVVYRAGGNLWMRSLATETSRELAGTAGAQNYPSWAPDSAWVGFAAGDELKKVSIDGGTPLVLGKLGASSFLGGAWSPDGEQIIFGAAGRLYRVAALGGVPELLFDSSEDELANVRHPKFLPADGGPPALVYTAAAQGNQSIGVMNLKTGERRIVGPGADPFYSNGHLIHGPQPNAEQGLWALPFSLETLSATGQEFPIANLGALASASSDGTLAYWESLGAGGGATRQLVWRDRDGQNREAVGQPQRNLREFSLAPDGSRVATTANDAGGSDIWVQDLSRLTTTRVTFAQTPEFHPAWSPSGNEIVYSSGGGARHLRRTSADGTAEPRDLTEGGLNLSTPDRSPDGRYLMFKDGGPSEESLYYLDLSAQTASFDRTPYLTGPGNSSVPKFSPDGRFVAFVSDQSGRNEIYIQPFPGASGRMQASVSGGTQPRWRSDGRELFYVEESALMAISVSANGQALALGRPQQLFESPELASVNTWPTYDVSADGQRFLTASVTAEEEAAPPTIRIVQNWLEEFRNRER